MKKILLIALALALLFPSSLWAAGSCTQTITNIPTATLSNPNPPVKVLKFTCIGDASNGSIPNTAISSGTLEAVNGMYLYTRFGRWRDDSQ
jgi:hypothetical protein